MPKFLEERLKKEYAGKDPSIPYKIMNARGFMHGNKITAKGRAAEAKHAKHDKTTPHGAREVETEAKGIRSKLKHVDADENLHEEVKETDRTRHKKSGATVIASAGRIDEKLKGFMIEKMRGYKK